MVTAMAVYTHFICPGCCKLPQGKVGGVCPGNLGLDFWALACKLEVLLRLIVA